MRTFLGLLVGVVLAFAVPLAWWMIPPTEEWVDMAKSHTGREMPVQRKVSFHLGSGDLSTALKRWPTKFSLKFTNPSDGKEVSWQGEQHVRPVLLDVVNGSAWLVVNANAVYGDVGKYGCPDVPFAFLKHDSKRGRWVPVAAGNAPSELRDANLMYGYERYMMPSSRIFGSDEIAQYLRSIEASTGGHFTRAIPRSFGEWKSGGKKSNASMRMANDCRPALVKPVDYVSAHGPSRQVEIEQLESKPIAPELVFVDGRTATQQTWSDLMFDKERTLACRGRVKLADEQDLQLRTWQRFVLDTTQTRVFPNAYSWLCDADAVWIFGTRTTERGRVVITKTTNDGVILYKVSFPRPTPSDKDGAARVSTFRAVDGFVQFEWISFNPSGREIRATHSSTYRFREPS